MHRLKSNYKRHFSDRSFTWSFILAFTFLIIALIINFYADMYATRSVSNSVTDIILSNIRVYDVDTFFVYGPWIMWIFVACVTISKPYQMPFIVKSIALFVIIRSVFISLTHIAPFPSQMVIPTSKFVTNFTTGGDLFFSAHTGLPFLMAVIFWDHKILRYIFIATSIFFGIIVLLGHVHYSIDVLSAFFITFSIYHISEWLFPKDKKVFDYVEEHPELNTKI